MRLPNPGGRIGHDGVTLDHSEQVIRAHFCLFRIILHELWDKDLPLVQTDI